MLSPIKAASRTKLGQDIFWNYISLGVLAVSGILINVIIAGAYGAATLGVFNQAYAIYIIASQFAVGGVHLSVLKHVAEFVQDRNKCNGIVSSAIALSLIWGVITAIVIFSLRGLFGNLLGSPEVSKCLTFVAPALVFFSLNKVLIAMLNGLRHMKLFAFAQAARYILMISFIMAASVLSLPGYVLAATFIFSELTLFFILLILARPYASFVHYVRWDNWFKIHAIFGIKGFISGVLIQLNTRVDVLMLGFFFSDQVVGIYSFAAILAEGLFQIPIIIKNNIDPILVTLISDRNFDGIKQLVRKTQKLLYPAMTLISLLAVGLFPLGVSLLYGKSDFAQCWPIFAILVVGILISSGYIPFKGIMIQAGLPEYYTMLNVMVVGSNIILNTIMIPIWGIYGAAIATSSSFVLVIVYLNALVRKQLKFSLR